MHRAPASPVRASRPRSSPGSTPLWQLAGRLSRGRRRRRVPPRPLDRARRARPAPAVRGAGAARSCTGHSFVAQFANIYYATMHFGVLFVFLIWLFVRHRDRYRPVRGCWRLTTFVCLLIQLIPVAPPRLLPGFEDTAVASTASPCTGSASAPTSSRRCRRCTWPGPCSSAGTVCAHRPRPVALARTGCTARSRSSSSSPRRTTSGPTASSPSPCSRVCAAARARRAGRGRPRCARTHRSARRQLSAGREQRDDPTMTTLPSRSGRRRPRPILVHQRCVLVNDIEDDRRTARSPRRRCRSATTGSCPTARRPRSSPPAARSTGCACRGWTRPASSARSSAGTPGSFRVAPTDVSVPVARRYLPGTMVLETSWGTDTGWIIVRDAC